MTINKSKQLMGYLAGKTLTEKTEGSGGELWWLFTTNYSCYGYTCQQVSKLLNWMVDSK